MPDPILTPNLLSKFESCAESKNVDATKKLISELPSCNRDTFTWLIVHFANIIENVNIYAYFNFYCNIQEIFSINDVYLKKKCK